MTAGDETFSERDRTEDEAAMVRGWADQLIKLDHLHRYTTVTGDSRARFEKLVLESEMYFTPFEKLNDPFDGAVRPILDDATPQQIRGFWLGWFAEQGKTPSAGDLRQIEYFAEHAHDAEVQARVRTIHDEEMAQLGVRCFTEPRDDDLPMWAYYADAHRGVCVRFRPSLMLGWGGLPPMPVEYAIKRPSFYSDTRFMRIYRMVATKATVWSHEREWRMVRAEGKMTFPAAALDSVIMGCRIEPDVEDYVRGIVARRPDVHLFKTRPSEHEFKLVILPA